MKRRGVLGAGVALGAAVAISSAARAAELPAVSDADLAAARALFAAGSYDRRGRLLPQLLDGAEHSAGAGSAGAARAAGVWVLASQLAVKQSRTEPAGATPLRRTGRAPQALALLQEAATG